MKAIINLINSWAYRCEHNWELLEKRNILDRELYLEGKEVSARTEWIYWCDKCGKSNIIK